LSRRRKFKKEKAPQTAEICVSKKKNLRGEEKNPGKLKKNGTCISGKRHKEDGVKGVVEKNWCYSASDRSRKGEMINYRTGWFVGKLPS